MPSVLETYTKKELLKKYKNQKLMVFMKVIVVIAMVVFSVYYTINNEVAFLTFLPLFFIPMLVIMIIELKNIGKELATRK